MAIIELKDLTKKYGQQTVVDALNLNIAEGEVFGLLGPNGAGKTTTILMMLGLIEPTSGEPQVCDVNATRHPLVVKKRVGYLPDDIGFYEDRTGLENLLYTAYLNRIPENVARQRAQNLLKRVNLQDAQDKPTGNYSRGMRQRLGIADILMKEPDVIILDEPTLGIDPEGVRELLALIRSLSVDEGLTVLLSSHHLHQVQQICDRVGLFVSGRLLAVGDIHELAADIFKGEPIVIYLEVDEAPPPFIERLQQLEEVQRVETTVTENGQPLLTISSEKDISAEVVRLVVQNDLNVQSITKKDYGLDEIYHRYFQGGDGHEQAATIV